MAAQAPARMTAGAIAKELGVADAKVKKVIKDLKIQPKEKKGPCCYYGPDDLSKIKSALK